MKVLPHFSRSRWGGGTDLNNDVNGWSLSVEWLGLFVEFCFGRVK